MRFYLLILLLLAACTGVSGQVEDPATPTVPPPSPTPLTQAATPMPTAQVTPELAVNLRIWWPEALAPTNNPAVTNLLSEHIESFTRAEEREINVEFRLKRLTEAGGIMPTLRTASVVAPGALPDITLLRREELVSAINDNLIYPMEGLVPPAVIGDLYDNAFALGRDTDNGDVYGLPYTLEIRHLVYRTPEADQALTDWSFDAVLEREATWFFPAGRVGGVSNTVYVQYLDAGGTPPDENGDVEINADALLTVLQFYEDARQQGIIDESVLSFSSTGDYLDQVIEGTLNNALLTSDTYFTLVLEGADLRAAPIPTESGIPASTLNGWIWVITTTNPEQQRLAADFIDWMMEPGRHRQLVEAVNTLPSQQTVMQLMSGNPDQDLMEEILENAVVPLGVSSAGAFTRAIQSAFTTVISGESTAEEATQVVVEQLSND